MKCMFLLILLPIAACTNDPRTKADTKNEDGPTENASEVMFTGNELPAELKEISGMTRDGESLWAISDAAAPKIYKLDKEGKIVHETGLGITVTDMESLTSDESYVYIADMGNKNGKRGERTIIRIPKAELAKNKSTTKGETINFTFPAENMDSEAMMAHGDSLYIFTKQNDDMTQLFALPKKPGKYTAQKRGEMEAGGLITGASINHAANEVALIGYRKGHKHPYVILINDFKGNSFLSGKTERYELDKQSRDWQVESISYMNDDLLSFACEGTKDVPQTLYTIDRATLVQLPQDAAIDESKSSGKKEGKNDGKKGKKKKKNKDNDNA